MESLDLRIYELERALGCVEGTEVSKEDVDILAVRKSLAERGFNHALKVPIEKLKRLKQVTTKPSMRPLSEKLNSIQFCEELIRKRAAMLEDFESRIKPVLESDSIAAVPSHDAALDGLQVEIEKSLDLWREHTMELDSFKQELYSVIFALQNKVDEMTTRVEIVEKAAGIE